MSGQNKKPKVTSTVAPNTPSPDGTVIQSVAGESAVVASAPVTPVEPVVAAVVPEMSGRDVMLQISSQGRAVGLSADKILEIQGSCTTLGAGKDAILAALSTENSDVPPVQTARVIRDESEARRAGMGAALVAQIMNVDPTNEMALPYMNHSIVEMAALSVGMTSRSLRTTADREAVLNAGFHATSDFPAIFEDAMNKALLARYQMAEPTYRQISRQRNFKDFRLHNMVRAGDFPKLQKVGEGGEIKSGTFSDSKETAAVVPYAVQFAITRQMLVNDDLNAIDEVINDYGNEVADFEERTFYAFKAGAKLSDNKSIYHADHKNLATGGDASAITVDAIGLGRAAMRKQTTKDKRKINVTAKILLVSPDKETEAEKLVASIQANDEIKVNPFSGKLRVVSPAELEGNAWELIAEPSRVANFVWGYLDGYEAPRIRMAEPFGTQGVKISLEHDFGVGAADYRGGFKNTGA